MLFIFKAFKMFIKVRCRLAVVFSDHTKQYVKQTNEHIITALPNYQ